MFSVFNYHWGDKFEIPYELFENALKPFTCARIQDSLSLGRDFRRCDDRAKSWDSH